MKNIDWSSLSFGYTPTDYNVRCYYRNGKWGEGLERGWNAERGMGF